MGLDVESTFAALGDPVRSAIVNRLSERDATVGELAGLFAITFQAVSQQIGALERAGLVTRHREGRTRRVQLEPAALDQAAGWLEARRRQLEERYQRLDEVLAELNAQQAETNAQQAETNAQQAETNTEQEKRT